MNDGLLALTEGERAEVLAEIEDQTEPFEIPPLTPEQMDELDRRCAAFEADPSIGRKWEDVRANLKALLE